MISPLEIRVVGADSSPFEFNPQQPSSMVSQMSFDEEVLYSACPFLAKPEAAIMTQDELGSRVEMSLPFETNPSEFRPGTQQQQQQVDFGGQQQQQQQQQPRQHRQDQLQEEALQQGQQQQQWYPQQQQQIQQGQKEAQKLGYWKHVKKEAYKLICTDCEHYAKTRESFSSKSDVATTYVLSTLSAAVASHTSFTVGMVTPLVAVILFSLGRVGVQSWCLLESNDPFHQDD